MINCSYFL